VILDNVMGMFSKDMGMDLGTANTLVAVRGEGIVLDEPSVVAVRKGSNKVLMDGNAVGDMAKEMLGKTPASIVAVRPLKDGVISDFEIAEAMIGYFIRRVHGRSWAAKPRIIIGVPSGITSVEKRAVIESAEAAGAREVFLIEEPMAAAIGAGLPVTEPRGNMIIDIGGGTTDVAVISLAGIVSSESLRTAGDEMDDAICSHMRKTYNLLIGPATAERIKQNIGSASPLQEEITMEVKGRDLIAGLPRGVTIRSEEIREALAGPVSQIIETARLVLERTEPELASDLIDQGITLCGGGALLRGLDEVIAQETGLPVQVAPEALTCVARGTVEVLEQLDLLKQILESSRDTALSA
jgi:rod shape-determining protein MreB